MDLDLDHEDSDLDSNSLDSTTTLPVTRMNTSRSWTQVCWVQVHHLYVTSEPRLFRWVYSVNYCTALYGCSAWSRTPFPTCITRRSPVLNGLWTEWSCSVVTRLASLSAQSLTSQLYVLQVTIASSECQTACWKCIDSWIACVRRCLWILNRWIATVGQYLNTLIDRLPTGLEKSRNSSFYFYGPKSPEIGHWWWKDLNFVSYNTEKPKHPSDTSVMQFLWIEVEMWRVTVTMHME